MSHITYTEVLCWMLGKHYEDKYINYVLTVNLGLRVKYEDDGVCLDEAGEASSGQEMLERHR